MNINTLLPASGAGFVTNNRGPSGKFQFGQKSTIDAAVAVGASWNALSPEHPFSIGQISLKGGGQMPPHKSHRVGLDVDVRPMRTDGANEPLTITDSQYDRAATTELIALWWKKRPSRAVFRSCTREPSHRIITSNAANKIAKHDEQNSRGGVACQFSNRAQLALR